jgi:hypothetical protein
VPVGVQVAGVTDKCWKLLELAVMSGMIRVDESAGFVVLITGRKQKSFWR